MKIFIIFLLFYSTIWGLETIPEKAEYESSPAKFCFREFSSYFNRIVKGEVMSNDMNYSLKKLKENYACIKKKAPKFSKEFKAKLDALTSDIKKRKDLTQAILVDYNCMEFDFKTWRKKTSYTAKDINGFAYFVEHCPFKKIKKDLAMAKKDKVVLSNSSMKITGIENGFKKLNEMVSNQKKAVLAILENSKKDLKKLPLQSFDKAENAVNLAKFTNSLVNNKDTQKTLADAKKALANVAKLFSKYQTSDFHKQNIGKTFLSDKPIKIKKEDPSSFKKVFTANDKIYVMGYEKTRIYDYIGPYEAFITINLKKDGKSILYYKSFISYKNKRLKNAYLNFQLLPGNTPVKKIKNMDLSYKLIKALNKLGKGKHKLQLTIGVYVKSNPMLPNFGSVKFEFDNNGEVDLGELEKKYAKEALNRVRMPRRGKRNKRLEKKMLKAIKKNRDWKEKPLRAVITGKNFDYNRSTYSGKILGRHIWAAVAVKRKNKTCSIFRIRFYQEKVGRRWANPTLGMVAGNEDINCKNVWKK